MLLFCRKGETTMGQRKMWYCSGYALIENQASWSKKNLQNHRGQKALCPHGLNGFLSR